MKEDPAWVNPKGPIPPRGTVLEKDAIVYITPRCLDRGRIEQAMGDIAGPYFYWRGGGGLVGWHDWFRTTDDAFLRAKHLQFLRVRSMKKRLKRIESYGFVVTSKGGDWICSEANQIRRLRATN